MSGEQRERGCVSSRAAVGKHTDYVSEALTLVVSTSPMSLAPAGPILSRSLRPTPWRARSVERGQSRARPPGPPARACL